MLYTLPDATVALIEAYRVKRGFKFSSAAVLELISTGLEVGGHLDSFRHLAAGGVVHVEVIPGGAAATAPPPVGGMGGPRNWDGSPIEPAKRKALPKK